MSDPREKLPEPSATKTLSRASMGLEIFSLFPILITGILGAIAVVLGHVVLNRVKRMPIEKSVRRWATVGLITGYIGIGLNGFIVWSAYNAASEMAMRIKCSSNIKQLYLAVQIWSGDHHDALPEKILDMTNELKNPDLLICPADSKRLRNRSKLQYPWDPTNSSYEFFFTNWPQTEDPNRVLIRCRIHGTELMGDGSVREFSDLAQPNGKF